MVLFLVVILISLGLVCFVKSDEKGLSRMEFMIAYLAFIMILIEKII